MEYQLNLSGDYFVVTDDSGSFDVMWMDPIHPGVPPHK